MHILVVDDKQNILDSLSQLLTKQGHSVETACNGLDALNKSQQTKYELFIIDHLMPVMNGLQLSKNLRHREQTAQTPLVFMTTQGTQAIETLPERSLFTAVIEKPIIESHFINLISSLLGQNTLRQSL